MMDPGPTRLSEIEAQVLIGKFVHDPVIALIAILDKNKKTLGQMVQDLETTGVPPGTLLSVEIQVKVPEPNPVVEINEQGDVVKVPDARPQEP